MLKGVEEERRSTYADQDERSDGPETKSTLLRVTPLGTHFFSWSPSLAAHSAINPLMGASVILQPLKSPTSECKSFEKHFRSA